MGFRDLGLGAWGLRNGFRVQGLGIRGLGCRVWSIRALQGLVSTLGFRVSGDESFCL